MRFHTKSGLGLLSLLLAVPGWSGVLYSNGPINGTVNSWPIGNGDAVTDSFFLESDSILTGVSHIGLWMPALGPATIDWVISTEPLGGGTVEGSGSGVTLTTTFVGTNHLFAHIYEVSFSIGNLLLSAGTHYLQLSTSETAFWDQSNGPSSAYAEYDGEMFHGDPFSTSGLGSNSFQIDGGIATAPEPTGLATLGAGIVALAALRRYRQQR